MLWFSKLNRTSVDVAELLMALMRARVGFTESTIIPSSRRYVDTICHGVNSGWLVGGVNIVCYSSNQTPLCSSLTCVFVVVISFHY